MFPKLGVAAAAAILLVTGCSRHSQSANSTSSDFADPRNPNAAATTPAPPPMSTLPTGTYIRIRLTETLDTKYCRAGQGFTGVVDEPIVVGRRVIVPAGATIRGHITESKQSGRLKGRAVLGLSLDTMNVDGTSYPIATNMDARVSGAHKKRNLAIIGGSAGGGAAIGAAAGGGVGAAIGAGVGAGAGTVGALLTGRKQVVLPAETRLMFSLRAPVNVRG
jgi:hypothetical protein